MIEESAEDDGARHERGADDWGADLDDGDVGCEQGYDKDDCHGRREAEFAGGPEDQRSEGSHVEAGNDENDGRRRFFERRWIRRGRRNCGRREAWHEVSRQSEDRSRAECRFRRGGQIGPAPADWRLFVVGGRSFLQEFRRAEGGDQIDVLSYEIGAAVEGAFVAEEGRASGFGDDVDFVASVELRQERGIVAAWGVKLMRRPPEIGIEVPS